MLVGHISVGLIGKRLAPETSLGTLVLAALAADLLWCLLLLAGVERVELQPGATTQAALAAIAIPYSHGLLPDVLWAGLFAAVYFVVRRYPRGAWVLLAAVLSHWLLDVVSHRRDMPLAPGLSVRFGLGLWNSLAATLLIEGGFWICAVALYVTAPRRTSRAATTLFWAGVAVLTAAWWSNIAGPPPRGGPSAMASASFIFFLVVVIWAYGVDRLARRGGPPGRKAHRM